MNEIVAKYDTMIKQSQAQQYADEYAEDAEYVDEYAGEGQDEMAYLDESGQELYYDGEEEHNYDGYLDENGYEYFVDEEGYAVYIDEEGYEFFYDEEANDYYYPEYEDEEYLEPEGDSYNQEIEKMYPVATEDSYDQQEDYKKESGFKKVDYIPEHLLRALHGGPSQDGSS